MNSRPPKTSGCQVRQFEDLAFNGETNIQWATVFDRQCGARALSLYYLRCAPGETPWLYFGASESVLYLLEGQATAVISGVPFDARPGCGLHVRQGEDCQFVTDEAGHAAWLAVVCPQRANLQFSGQQKGTFDTAYPDRLVDGDSSEMHSTEDRFYKLLVGPRTGSESVTQFIGKIPKSRAPEHYHLYEEVICILSGHGRMWAGDQAFDVRPGSMIFLAREQPHSLECMNDGGMDLVGMFYPAGSPAINYKT